MWGCQEQGSGPVAPDGLGPQFTHKDPGKVHGGPKGGGDDDSGEGGPTLLFENPTSFSCEFGAEDDGEGSFGKVSWAAVFSSDVPVRGHVHFKLELKGVTAGDYTIVGTQFKTTSDPNCNADVTIGTFTVGPNERGSTRTEFILPDHSPGESNVWVTVSSGGPLYQSPAFTIVMREHTSEDGH